MVWWKVALPVVIAGSGITAAVVATVRSDDTSAAAATAVWIDAPADLAALHAGPVTVTAHVDASDGTSTLTLMVDGSDVATDDQLDIVDQLAHAEFTWQAEPGVHELVVTAPDGSVSGTHTVFVEVEGGTFAPTTTVAPPTTVAATTSTTSTTSTTLPPSTTVAVTTPQTTARPTTVPVTAPRTTPPVTVPRPSMGVTTLALGDCSVTVNVGSFRDTTSATARVSGGGNDTTVDMPLTTPSSVVVGLVGHDSTSYQLTVTVTATGPGGTSTSSTGITASSCKL